MSCSTHGYTVKHATAGAFVLPFTTGPRLLKPPAINAYSARPIIQQHQIYLTRVRAPTCVIMLGEINSRDGHSNSSSTPDVAGALAAANDISVEHVGAPMTSPNVDKDDRGNNNTSNGSFESVNNNKRAPASAQHALDDARKLVKERRQNARDRYAKSVAAAATGSSDGRRAGKGGDATAVPLTKEESDSTAMATGKAALAAGFGVSPDRPLLSSPGSAVPGAAYGKIDVDVAVAKATNVSVQPPATAAAATTTKTSASKLRSVVGQQSSAARRQPSSRAESRVRRVGRRGRRRALPDFVSHQDSGWVAEAMPAPAVGSDAGKGEASDDDNVALVAAIRATLASTVAQLDKHKTKTEVVAAERGPTTVTAAGATTAVLAGLPEYDKPQVRTGIGWWDRSIFVWVGLYSSNVDTHVVTIRRAQFSSSGRICGYDLSVQKRSAPSVRCSTRLQRPFDIWMTRVFVCVYADLRRREPHSKHVTSRTDQL